MQDAQEQLAKIEVAAQQAGSEPLEYRVEEVKPFSMEEYMAIRNN